MVKHVVMWKFLEGEKESMQRFLLQLDSLKGVIPEIVDMEIGISFKEKNNFDAILIATFNSKEDLETYLNDPRHVAVSALCKAIRTDRAAVDFEY